MQEQIGIKKLGRRAFNPTDADRLKVARMASLGTPQSQIAAALGITRKTLSKHCQQELSATSIDADLQVAEALFKMATSGKHPAASIFWAKTRNGIQDTATVPKLNPPSTIVVLNNDGAPIAHD